MFILNTPCVLSLRLHDPSAQIALANKLNAQGKHNNLTLLGVLMFRTIPPFIPSHDVARGFFQGAQSLLSFSFMLAAM